MISGNVYMIILFSVLNGFKTISISFLSLTTTFSKNFLSAVVADLVTKATDIVFDETVQKTIKEFIMIVEEKNQIAKQKGEIFLAGDEKKQAVIQHLSEWVSNLTESTEKAIGFVEDNQSKIESIIDDYISFSNKMHGKSTLSEAEKIIADKLNK